MLDWWDLLGMGDEFSHETLERRIELAEIRFTDGLHHNLRTRLKRALPKLGLQHENVGGFFGITDPHYSDRLRATPLDPRQKRPMMETVVGRMQTPLMEAIDRRQLEIARNLVNKGDDLNFINSTGDTCVTKAFACKYYSLILEILQRDENPIQRDTLLLVTEMMKISALEQTLSTGQIAILREMTRWKDGRGDIIDLNKERVWGQTPLYYTLNCLAHQRMKPEQAVSVVMQQFEGPAVTRKLSPELIKLAHQRMQKEYDQVGVIECIAFMIRDLQVDLEGLNVNNNTALTFAAEKSMRDIAGMLLAAGASVNHQFVGGGTALVRAIQNDDCELGRLLLEYGANPNLYVDALGRPIHAMTMSEKMRQLVSCTG
jgi:ankyrin repeat protein